MSRDESKIPNILDSQGILLAAEAYDAGVDHGFHDSTKFDVIINNKRYPPKAIIGIASTTATGIRVVPKDFTGGLGSKCFRILEELNFPIVPKTTFMEAESAPLILGNHSIPSHMIQKNSTGTRNGRNS